VLFYGFAVVAPEVTNDTGWSESIVAGAFSVGLLVAGVTAPAVARALSQRDPRFVLTAGSILGAAGMLLFAGAHHVAVLYGAWVVIGVAMAATLYEPAMAVLIAIDPARRHRTLATVTVAGGLASTVFAPLGGVLVDRLGWRTALTVLAIGGGASTAILHAFVLPAARTLVAPPEPASPEMLDSRPVRRLRVAMLFEQAALLATTAHLIGLLVDRGATLATAGAVLGVMGLGKVAGRLLLLGPVRGVPLATAAAACSAVQLVGLAVPLGTTGFPVLLASAAIVGAASGATTVLRPLILVELVGAGPFAAVNGHLQRSTTLSRAGAPFALGAGAATIGWGPSWAIAIAAFAIAAERYVRLQAEQRTAAPLRRRST